MLGKLWMSSGRKGKEEVTSSALWSTSTTETGFAEVWPCTDTSSCCYFICTVKSVPHSHFTTSNLTLTLIETVFTSVPSLFLMTDSGVGAGIDSYYEYLMKAYILLGDKVYLNRFNTVRALCSAGIIMPLLARQSLFYIYYLHMWLCLCLLWQHYSAIMKYISQPPMLLNVHMHNPTVNVRSWMDSLLAFFPGLQVHFFILCIPSWLRE